MVITEKENTQHVRHCNFFVDINNPRMKRGYLEFSDSLFSKSVALFY